MTNEELQAHIKALNDAALAGEIEQSGGWQMSWHPIARLCYYEYRIKPKPRDVWLYPGLYGKCSDSDRVGHDNERSVQNCAVSAEKPKGSGWVHFREVLE